MFVQMKQLLLAAALLAGCRPSDSGSQSSPSASARTKAAAARSAADSARIDSLLTRADAGRIQGSPSASIWLVEISDFQCPFCKRWHDEVYPVIKRDYIDRGIVRMAYVNLPLQMHAHALPAAEAALCAAVQNKFWPMHDQLFATQERWAALATPGALFDSLARSVGVTAPDWRECVRGQLMRRVVNGDLARAAAVGVRSTPVFFVGDEPIQGAAPLDTFRVVIERARAKAAARSPN